MLANWNISHAVHTVYSRPFDEGIGRLSKSNTAIATFEKLMGNDVGPRKEFIIEGVFTLDTDRIDA
jgi:hypothetical protein